MSDPEDNQFNYFKLRLEDGSDVKYNSLVFSKGDDLVTPLTYNIEEDDISNILMVTGENKHIPIGEAQYITYKITSKKDMQNVLCNIDVIDTEEESALDIIIAGDEQVSILNGDTDKFCVIDKLKANEEKEIKFIIQSDIERTCIFKLKVLNYDLYDTIWTPSNIYFTEIPSIKMSIETDNDDLLLNDFITISYTFENQSYNTWENLKFRIIEPYSFDIQNIPDIEQSYIIYNEDLNGDQEPVFNETTRVLTIPQFSGITFDEVNNENQTSKYTLQIKYKAIKKGIFDFKISTYDDKNTMEDDQWNNVVTKKVLVNISNDTFIKTYVNNQRPYLDELIDFTIDVKNYLKAQNNVSFTIKDINDDTQKSYELVYSNYTTGTFQDKSGCIGIWNIENLDIDEECTLMLTLRPKNLGYHNISTTFNDSTNNIKDYSNTVLVLAPNKQIEFNVYHAKNLNETPNCDCDTLTYICDEDFIDINEDLYYVCEITNNNRNAIQTPTHIYARIDQNFLENGILCSSHDITQNTNNLLEIIIPEIQGCSTVKTCFRVKPSKIGTYISNFILTGRNTKLNYKNLKIHVDKDFSSKKIEHEIKIYNFEKTNKYFRYELDNNNDIYKFFNQGSDRTLRPVSVEDYNQGNVEIYKGTNLRKLIRDIANNSKYVEPEILRIGSNKFAPKGYELYPDSFMRRFGLLNSEVFHYTGQLPTIGYLADYAMRWDIDNWDEKVWSGGIYNNGVFDLTINYDKIPTNFNILELKNPINNLQTLVDKVKPFGTQAICYYSAKIFLDMALDMNLNNFIVENNISLPLNISKNIELLSLYKRHDNSLISYYDILLDTLQTDTDYFVDVNTNKISPNNDDITLNTDLKVNIDKFDSQYSKKNISDCFDIVQDLYSYNTNISNINIVRKFNYEPQRNRTILNNIEKNTIYTIEYDTINNFDIFIGEKKYNIDVINDQFNNFIGFQISSYNNILFNVNYNTNIYIYHIQIQVCEYEDKKIIHIFNSINEKEYIHIGYLIANKNDIIKINPYEYKSYSQTTEDPIKFKIDDTTHNIIQKPKKIITSTKKNRWENIDNINKKNKYAKIENNNNIDEECKKEYLQTSIFGLKYKDFNIDNYDEITDISFKIKAKTNKENFADDIDITVLKDGDKYIPDDGIARQNFYPSTIMNKDEQYLSDIIIQQPNITICSKCLKTSLGLYDECPYCGSIYVSQYDQKKAVTICQNPDCGWIYDGWNDYCHHCLSTDVVKTKVDFNKTYCYNDGYLADDYYPACPKCFSTNIIHLNNDEKKYIIKDITSQNIEPITIKKDANRINIFNATINNDHFKTAIDTFKTIKLHITGQNNNDGKFYYCPECNNIELKHTNKCSYCNNTQIELKEYNNITMDIYYKDGDYVKKLDTDTEYDQINGKFDISINVLELANLTTSSNFQLLIYIENLLYDEIDLELNKLDLSEKSYNLLHKNIQSMNIVIDNIYYEYEYLTSYEWEIDKMYGNEHIGVKYQPLQENNTNDIYFSDFNIPKEQYTSIFLNIHGINKTQDLIKMDINIIHDDNTIDTYTVDNISPNLFSTKINLLDFINDIDIDNIGIKIKFQYDKTLSDIIITNCYITTEKQQQKNILYTNLEPLTYKIKEENDTIIIHHTNLYNINDTKPHYLDGNQLKNGIVCYFNFGKLKNNEYIRLYDIDMIIQYKNKYGRINTDYINIDGDTYTKQLINANIQKNNTEFWGIIKTPLTILNNLESEIVNNTETESLQSVPLLYELSQAFINDTTEISKIELNYNGCIGYPNDIITFQIYDDYQNSPGNLIFSKEIIMPKSKGIVSIDTNLNSIEKGQYWFKIIDQTANKNNHHKFYYNTNTEVGNLLINKNNGKIEKSNIALSFSIGSGLVLQQYAKTPITINLNGVSETKTYYTLYRYNTKSINNTYLSDISTEYGYEYCNEVTGEYNDQSTNEN